MTSSDPAHGQSALCRPAISAAGLPHRDEVILERERHLFPLMAGRLLRRGKGAEAEGPEPLPLGALEEAFKGGDPTILPAAAFLAGRCQPESPQDGERISQLLRKLIASLRVAELDINAPAYIQAAMSLALRGDIDAGRQALLPLVGRYASSTPESYLAAFYLAQMGDPSGYPAIRAELRSQTAHWRLMALRHLIAFKPYAGQRVAGETVDLSRDLAAMANDPDPYVRVEVPYHLAEAGVSGLNDLLAPMANTDSSEDVRREAARVLADTAQT